MQLSIKIVNLAVLQDVKYTLSHIFEHFSQTMMPLIAMCGQIDLQQM